MVATINILSRNQVIDYVGQHAAAYGLDPAAVLAVANHEGLNTSPGSSWTVPGESKISFGPPSWFAGGAGGGFLTQFGNVAAAWSPQGIDYWLNAVAQTARGLTGADAIRAIVTGFERPRADLVQGEINNALSDYGKFQQAVSGGVQVPTVPGQTTAPGQTTTDPISGGAGMLKLGQIGPLQFGVPTGLLLGLIAVVLLMLGAIIMAGPQRAAEVAAMA